MSKRQNDWAVRARQELIDDLGGRCFFCDANYDLELNHIYGRTWKAREISSSWRIAFYRRDAKAGLLNVLCGECNKKYRPIKKPDKKEIPKESIPF